VRLEPFDRGLFGVSHGQCRPHPPDHLRITGAGVPRLMLAACVVADASAATQVAARSVAASMMSDGFVVLVAGGRATRAERPMSAALSGGAVLRGRPTGMSGVCVRGLAP
jgi:hypothetical protein